MTEETTQDSMDVTVDVDMNVATESMADQLEQIADAFSEAASSLRDTPPGESSPTTRHGRGNSSEKNCQCAASSNEESRPSRDDDSSVGWLFDADGSVTTLGDYEFVCTVECETRYARLERDCITFDGSRVHEWVCPRCSHVNYTTPMLYDTGDDDTA